jgi:hypothetical protein
MSIDADVLNSKTVTLLCDMYADEYTSRSSPHTRDPVPLILNALGACAGFAAQVAVWRDLVLPAKRNPGDFFVYTTAKSHEIFLFGEAINQFLLSTMPDRLSFLNLAAASLRNASELLDIPELLAHVINSMGTDHFGRPRTPPSVDLPELPRDALTRTWGKATRILEEHRPGEWPALLGATAYNIVTSHRKSLAPSMAVKILLEAAVPMSKLNPATVEQSGIPAPSLTNWSMRALRPENTQAIFAEVRSAMPVMPPRISARPLSIGQPTIAFVNLSGTGCDNIVAEDSAEIGALFHGKVLITTAPVTDCDVLFLYCAVESSGNVVGQQASLRDLIGASGASVAVIASEVGVIMSPEFQKSLGRGNNPPANLVITGNRNGAAFSRFYKSLFQLMWTGIPMPAAWNELAPQAPQQPHDNTPGSICIMEAGQVMFGEVRLGESAASPASPSIDTRSGERSTPAARTKLRQRLTAVGVAGLALTLLKLVGWLATPARPTVPSYSGIASPQTGPLPPGLNLSGRYTPPDWGPIPGFPQARPDHPNASQ